jgi:hypothetical protein
VRVSALRAFERDGARAAVADDVRPPSERAAEAPRRRLNFKRARLRARALLPRDDRAPRRARGGRDAVLEVRVSALRAFERDSGRLRLANRLGPSRKRASDDAPRRPSAEARARDADAALARARLGPRVVRARERASAAARVKPGDGASAPAARDDDVAPRRERETRE